MKKTIVLLTCLILIPVVVLGWLAARLESHQQALLSHQIEGLVEVKLTKIDQQFQHHFQRLEEAINSESKALLQTKDGLYPQKDLKRLSQASPYIEQVFVISEQGTTLYPKPNSTNPRELAFLESTKRLRNAPETFQLQAEVAEPPALAVSPYNARLKTQPSKEITLAAPPVASTTADGFIAPRASLSDDTQTRAFIASGWIAWYNNSQLQHIYWRKDAEGALLGFAINSSRLLSDLINLLPESSAGQIQPPAQNSAMRLINSRGETLYEWGDPKVQIEQLSALDTLPLSHPLGSWKLEYYAPDLAQPASNWLGKLLLIFITLAGLLLLAWLTYRELTRTTRLAEQRVNFVNQVSHELKTPLTNVRMYAEMLERKLNDEDSKARRYLSVINSESQRLSRLIENVLTFSKLGKKPKPLHLQPGTLQACIERTANVFSPSLEQHGLTIELDLVCQKKVMFDQHCVEQILNNLISNCEKYAPQTGTVKISCYSKNEQSYIEVCDSGPGIPEHSTHKVFDPFYRVSNKLSDGVSGTGIGLSIAKDMARQHGGDLYLKPSQTGACFCLELHTPHVKEKDS